MMNHELPKDRIIGFLRELAAKDYQQRVWLASTGPEVSSLTEAICGLFDDTGLGDFLEKKGSVAFTEEIDERLRMLYRLAVDASHLFRSTSMSIPARIEHPKMDEVRRVAASILVDMKQAGTASLGSRDV